MPHPTVIPAEAGIQGWGWFDRPTLSAAKPTRSGNTYRQGMDALPVGAYGCAPLPPSFVSWEAWNYAPVGATGGKASA